MFCLESNIYVDIHIAIYGFINLAFNSSSKTFLTSRHEFVYVDTSSNLGVIIEGNL